LKEDYVNRGKWGGGEKGITIYVHQRTTRKSMETDRGEATLPLGEKKKFGGVIGGEGVKRVDKEKKDIFQWKGKGGRGDLKDRGFHAGPAKKKKGDKYTLTGKVSKDGRIRVFNIGEKTEKPTRNAKAAGLPQKGARKRRVG